MADIVKFLQLKATWCILIGLDLNHIASQVKLVYELVISDDTMLI